VYRLRDDNGLYGMRNLQFGFDGMPDNLHRPHDFSPRDDRVHGHTRQRQRGELVARLDRERQAEVAAYYHSARRTTSGG
jgi:hypothetical protein